MKFKNGRNGATGHALHSIARCGICALSHAPCDAPVEDYSFGCGVLRLVMAHVRNEHANVQIRINGIMLPDGISGFGTFLDTALIDNISLITGELPPRFGLRTSGVRLKELRIRLSKPILC
jgi:hypothetical protein